MLMTVSLCSAWVCDPADPQGTAGLRDLRQGLSFRSAVGHPLTEYFAIPSASVLGHLMDLVRCQLMRLAMEALRNRVQIRSVSTLLYLEDGRGRQSVVKMTPPVIHKFSI